MTATANTDLLIGYAYLCAGCVWTWRQVARNPFRATDDSWWVR